MGGLGAALQLAAGNRKGPVDCAAGPFRCPSVWMIWATILYADHQQPGRAARTNWALPAENGLTGCETRVSSGIEMFASLGFACLMWSGMVGRRVNSDSESDDLFNGAKLGQPAQRLPERVRGIVLTNNPLKEPVDIHIATMRAVTVLFGRHCRFM